MGAVNHRWLCDPISLFAWFNKYFTVTFICLYAILAYWYHSNHSGLSFIRWMTECNSLSDILLIAWVSVMAQKCSQRGVNLLLWILLWRLKHLAVSLWQGNCWLICVICASRQIDSVLTKEHFFTDDNQAIYLLVLIFLYIVCHNKLCSQLTEEKWKITICWQFEASSILKFEFVEYVSTVFNNTVCTKHFKAWFLHWLHAVCCWEQLSLWVGMSALLCS